MCPEPKYHTQTSQILPLPLRNLRRRECSLCTMKTSKKDAELLIEKLGLKPLPLEGGYFRETYRSDRKMAESGLGSQKSVSTCIYFLLSSDTFSAFHRLPSDEIWHFYAGDPVELFVINQDGKLQVNILSASLIDGTAPQAVVHGGCWQAACLAEGGSFALLGCTVAPAFDFADYEHGKRDELLFSYPTYSKEILKLTRSE